MTVDAPQVALDRAVATELARVLAVLAEFLGRHPAVRASLARFAYPHCGDPYFWTDELLDYLHQATTDLQEAL